MWCWFIAGLRSTKLTDVVLPTSGPTAGLLDTDTDERLGDEAAEAEMRENDVTDDDSDDEEMEADTAGDAQVGLYLLISVSNLARCGRCGCKYRSLWLYILRRWVHIA